MLAETSYVRAGVYAGNPAKLSMKAAFGKVWRLEDIGGSIIGGTIKLIQEKNKNPPPPRDLYALSSTATKCCFIISQKQSKSFSTCHDLLHTIL
jgi:protoporphyrinogen oxidase